MSKAHKHTHRHTQDNKMSSHKHTHILFAHLGSSSVKKKVREDVVVVDGIKNMIESGALFTIGIDIIIPVPLVSAIIAFYHFLLRVLFFCFVKPLKSGVLLAFGKPQSPAIRTIKLEFIWL